MTSATLFRSFQPDIEIRSNGDGRTVYGIAVPYGRAQRIDATLTEMFVPGAFARQLSAAHRVPYASGHMSQGGSLIGRVTELRDDAAGLYFEARITPTSEGRDVLELLRDGALDQQSIAFRPGQDRRCPDGTIERVTATLTEIAVVLDGAYGEHAAAQGVRQQAQGCTCGAQPTAVGHDVVARILAGLPALLPI